MGDDVIGDRKPRDLRQLVGYEARRPILVRPLDVQRFVGRRWKQNDPDLYYEDDKRSIRPMNQPM